MKRHPESFEATALSMDIVSKAKRSEMMSGIRSRNTRPELAVRRFIHGKGFRYRLQDRSLPGTPDLVLKGLKTVIFVNGCFWHGHTSSNCKLVATPKTHTEFWVNKISQNRKRDERNKRKLRRLGWHVLTIWECEIRENGLQRLLGKLQRIKVIEQSF